MVASSLNSSAFSMMLLLRFALELEDYGKAEQMPRLEGKRMIMMIAPVKKK